VIGFGEGLSAASPSLGFARFPRTWLTYVIAVAFAIFIFIWRELIKKIYRSSPNSIIAKIF